MKLDSEHILWLVINLGLWLFAISTQIAIYYKEGLLC